MTDNDECNSDTDSKNYDGDNDDGDDNGPLFTSTPKQKMWYRKAAAGGGVDDDSDASDTEDDPDDDNHGSGLDDGDADDASRHSVQSFYTEDQDDYSQFYRTDSFDLFLMNQSNLTLDDQDSGLMRETQDDFKIFVPEYNHTLKADKEDDEQEDEHTENDLK